MNRLTVMDLVCLFGSAALAFALAWWLTLQLSRGRWLLVLDHPNERSLHATPTPRTGGLAIVTAIALAQLPIALLYGLSRDGLVISVAAAMVLLVSVLDDLRNLPISLRLGVQAAAALLVLFFGFSLQVLMLPGWQLPMPASLGAVFSLLMVLWLINLYNFMDGMDGLAGGMGVIGFAALAALGAQAGDWGFAAVCAAIAAACGGFLVSNFPPARIFMGDAGSSVLGLLAAALSLKAHRDGLFDVWLSLLVFSPFIVDATTTLIRRALAREKVWKAHRSHFYQRVVGLGWDHRRTVLFEYLLMLACAASALSLQAADPGFQRMVLLAWAVTYAMLVVVITAIERRRASL